jgi:hypothetical protein
MSNTEGLVQIMQEIRNKVISIEQELARMRQIQENPQGLAPRFVENSPQIRTYSGSIENLFDSRYGMSHGINETFYVMGYFDQVMLNKLTPVAKQFKIISPATTVQTKKNKDALKRILKAGAEVRLHPMLHARIFCVPQRQLLIIGSGDIQTECFGGERFDAGIYSNNKDVIKQAMDFFNRVWEESEPMDGQTLCSITK